jgi:hypothetical protein
MRPILTFFFAVLGISIFAQEDRSAVKSYPAMSTQAEFLGAIPPLRDLAPRIGFSAKTSEKPYEKRNYFFGNTLKNPQPKPANGDPLAKPHASGERMSGPEIIPGFNFEGLHDPAGIYPADPTGDIGKNHYVQMVNGKGGSWFQVWDKETGNAVYGPALTSTIWSEVGASGIGDPIIQFDPGAERWLMLELEGANSNELLVAISDDSDPTGGWKAYRMQTLGFPDYPKIYVWHNAYFITINEIYGGNKCSGYALNRADMLAGEPEVAIYRFEMPNFMAVQFQPATGADWEGGPPPPPGSPGYIFRIYDDAWDGGQDHLESWEIFVDWNNVGLSHIDGPALLYPQPFETRVCFDNVFSFDCIEQPGGASPKIAALENTIMYRAPYRNFGDHESVVLNHVADVSGIVGDGGDAAVRWYELRKTGGGDWQLYQQGTYAPDLQTNRFMSTISLDEAGNIGLGYSGCSQNLYPGLYLTGQRNGDPLGEMSLAEHTLATGGASHTTNRWGDYSSMTVDPYDGRTFWFTGEYQPNNVDIWGTRIGSFKVRRDTFDIRPSLLLTPVASPFSGNTELVKVRISNEGIATADNISVSLYFEDNFVVTNNIPGNIAGGASLDYTFNQTVAMPQAGKDYTFRIITHWSKDNYSKNDTLNVVTPKLYAADAAMAGKYNLPGQVCGSETDFAIILKNGAGIPLQSARINWRINNQAWQVYDWIGNLAPGARDTIELHATGINDGVNELQAITSLPNGLQDESTSNDSLQLTFLGNTDGTYLTAASVSNYGVLHWELRTQNDVVLDMGEVSEQAPFAQICSDDNQCYRVVLRANAFDWAGHFTLKDIYDNVLVEITNASTQEQVFSICTPVRQQIDFGPLALVSPESGPNLTATEPVTLQFRNFGLTIQANASVSYRLNGGAWNTDVLAGPFEPSQTVLHTFSTTEDLSNTGIAYLFELRVTIGGDQNEENDTTSLLVYNRYMRELALLNIDGSYACNDTSFTFINLLVQNNGIGTEHLFDVEYSLNGVPQPTISNNLLSAASGQSAEILLYIPGLANGTNTVSLDITNVDNAGEDELPTNDSGSIAFDVSPTNQSLLLYFISDSHPEESSWDIVDSQGNIIDSGGPYTEPSGFNLRNLCLRKDSCYTFRLHDAGGNGLQGGYISISIGGFSLFDYSGENFGSEYSIPFCATPFCANLMLSANVTPASGSGSNDGKIVAMASGGNPPYAYILNDGDAQPSPTFGNLSSGAYTLACIDALGCAAEISINIGTVGAIEPEDTRQLLVSPNPTIGIAHITLTAKGNEKSAECAVYDSYGKLVQTARLARWDTMLRGNIALDRFPEGVYFVRVMGLDRQYVARVVKK